MKLITFPVEVFVISTFIFDESMLLLQFSLIIKELSTIFKLEGKVSVITTFFASAGNLETVKTHGIEVETSFPSTLKVFQSVSFDKYCLKTYLYVASSSPYFFSLSYTFATLVYVVSESGNVVISVLYVKDISPLVTAPNANVILLPSLETAGFVYPADNNSTESSKYVIPSGIVSSTFRFSIPLSGTVTVIFHCIFREFVVVRHSFVIYVSFLPTTTSLFALEYSVLPSGYSDTLLFTLNS